METAPKISLISSNSQSSKSSRPHDPNPPTSPHSKDPWEVRLSRVVKQFTSLTLRFWGNMLKEVENYLRRKSKQFPINPPKGRHAIINAVLDKTHHQDYLKSFSQESGMALDNIEKTFRDYLYEISADMNYLAFPFWDTLLTWVFDTIYEGLVFSEESLDMIRKVIAGKPVVFVSNHRSHMDYLILSYIFYRHQIPMPHICAGTNLSFWPLGPIFRKSGAFFIRRSYEGNKLYSYAVQAYMEEMIREKSCLEFFIEGGRSRTGKMLPPKMGILSAIVQAQLKGADEDVVMIPTSVNYESVLEEKNYMNEQSGASKKTESFWDLFSLKQYLKSKKGKVYIDFGDPLSLKDFLRKETFKSTDKKEQTKETVNELAYELTYGINKSSTVTTSSLVAMALLTHEKRSIPQLEVDQKVDLYLDYLRFKSSHLSDPLERYPSNAVRESLKNYSRSHLIHSLHDDEIGEQLYTIPSEKKLLLDYYKNTSLHFFVSIGVLSTILLSVPPNGQISFKIIEEVFSFVQNLFQYEFMFSRRRSLRDHLEKIFLSGEERMDSNDSG
ncbi:MAG: 1-acyl-sn-glycerol-3-phosphate acyltransferase [Deltaproteobacteria bacterium]|nr:MAG: 1-acyl-sn-glycerol-3-phosphate acyltransferase [Deltaproteobacteria bacterium]